LRRSLEPAANSGHWSSKYKQRRLEAKQRSTRCWVENRQDGRFLRIVI
jgi:hypothetical protein